MKRITISGGTFSIKSQKWNQQARDDGGIVILTAAHLRKKAMDKNIENSSYKLFLTDTTTDRPPNCWECLVMELSGKRITIQDMGVRRGGNFEIIDTGSDRGLISFSIGDRSKGWGPSSTQLDRRGAFLSRRISVNGTFIVSMGDNNDVPEEIMCLLNKFYTDEDIMGKIADLQWGEGPRLYEDAIDEENNRFYRRWKFDSEIAAGLESWDYTTVLHRSLVDSTHIQGFSIKFVRDHAPCVGSPGRLVQLEHIPYQKARLVYPSDGEDEPQEVLVDDFPYPDSAYTYRYLVFDPAYPLKYPVSAKYYNIYSFYEDFMSTPRFLGAFDWLELAGSLAAILIAYNENASAISLYIESPQSYWDHVETRIKQICDRMSEKYTAQMLEDFKDEAIEKFTSDITGRQSARKYMHMTKFQNPEANNFESRTVEPLGKEIKDYVDAQTEIPNKAGAAAISGFGLDSIFPGLIIGSKLSSESEKLYSLGVYNASGTIIPDTILCESLRQYVNVNLPGTTTKVGLYRTTVEAKQNVSPSNRMKGNAQSVSYTEGGKCVERIGKRPATGKEPGR